MSGRSMFDRMYDPPPPSLNVRLDVVLPEDPAEFQRAARLWLERGVELLAPHKVASLRAAPELPGKSLTRHLGSFGEPGTPWGSLVVHTDTPSGGIGIGGSLRAWTQKNWDSFIARDLAKLPRGVEAKFSQLDKGGHPGGGEFVHLRVERETEVDGWTSMMAHRQPLPEVGARDELALVWFEFLTTIAAELNPYVRFGCIGEDLTIDPTVPLENALRRPPGLPLREGRLRGYSWVTVLGEAALERVGGVAALERSGAFYEVRDLGGGAVVVRATPYPSQYDAEAVEKVFRALAAALPVGEPRPDKRDYRRLVWADAASVDQPG